MSKEHSHEHAFEEMSCGTGCCCSGGSCGTEGAIRPVPAVLGIALFAAALVPVALFFRREIIWCGVGISSVLVIGAVVINVLMRKNGKGGR